MKLLLTSAGIKNPSIEAALVGLLGKPTAAANALCVPTASYGMKGGAMSAWKLATGREPHTPAVELGWRSVGLLELTALPSVDEDHWVPLLRDTDALLVGGGDPMFLCHWVRQSGLADLLPTLHETVWVGISAGSMIMAPRIGEEFVGWRAPSGTDEALGLVDFAIFPHLDHPDLPHNRLDVAERWAAKLGSPAYAIDDDTAIEVVDGAARVVSEGSWHLLNT